MLVDMGQRGQRWAFVWFHGLTWQVLTFGCNSKMLWKRNIFFSLMMHARLRLIPHPRPKLKLVLLLPRPKLKLPSPKLLLPHRHLTNGGIRTGETICQKHGNSMSVDCLSLCQKVHVPWIWFFFKTNISRIAKNANIYCQYALIVAVFPQEVYSFYSIEVKDQGIPGWSLTWMFMGLVNCPLASVARFWFYKYFPQEIFQEIFSIYVFATWSYHSNSTPNLLYPDITEVNRQIILISWGPRNGSWSRMVTWLRMWENLF